MHGGGPGCHIQVICFAIGSLQSGTDMRVDSDHGDTGLNTGCTPSQSRGLRMKNQVGWPKFVSCTCQLTRSKKEVVTYFRRCLMAAPENTSLHEMSWLRDVCWFWIIISLSWRELRVKGRRNWCFMAMNSWEVALRDCLIDIIQFLSKGNRSRGSMRERLDSPEVSVRFPCIQ